MNEEFSGLVFECLYLGIQTLTVIKEGDLENKVLLYFTREPDSTEVPLCVTEIAAQQLYEDLEKIFQNK